MLKLDPVYFKDNVDDVSLWIPAIPVGHSAWITRLTCTLVRSFVANDDHSGGPGCFYSLLLPVCQLVPEFCFAILPHVVQAMLDVISSEDQRSILSGHINAALNVSANNNAAAAGSLEGDLSLKTLLQVVQHLRQHQKPGAKGESKWNHNFRLELNYLNAARASQSLSAYFSTVKSDNFLFVFPLSI